MKSFSQFSEQAYIAREELIEAAVLRRGLSRVAQRGALKLVVKLLQDLFLESSKHLVLTQSMML